MRLFRIVLLFVMIVVFAGVADAQVGIYGTFTGTKLSTANSPWIYGGTVGVYRDHGHGLIATGVDVRGEFLNHSESNGNSTTLKSGLGGIRLAITPHVLPLKPYAEGLIGVGHVEVGQGSARTSSTSFAYRVLGGLDYTFFPRLDWRVVEFGYGGFSGNASGVHPRSLSSGLVIRLPF
jgi:hypothetical protein